MLESAKEKSYDTERIALRRVLFKNKQRLGLVAHVCNLRTQGAKARG